MGAQGEASAVGNLRSLPFPPLFRSDNDDAIRATRTIDGRCRCVFQHIEALNVLRVDGRKDIRDTLHTRIINRNIVDNDQRIVGSIQRRAATNAHRCCATGRSVIAGDAHTGHFSRDHVLWIHHEALVLAVGFQCRHRAGQV